MAYTESTIYQDYAKHCSRMNPGDPAANFPGFDANLATLLPADRNAPILDFGCGMGHLLLYLRARGYKATEGIDVSESQIAHCHSLSLQEARHVLESDVFLGSRQGQYAAILAMDVMEHLPKTTLIPMLSAIHAALCPGGVFIMRVPNIAAFIGAWARYRDLTHETAFCEDSAIQAFEIAGFTEIRILTERTAYRRKLLGFGFELIRTLFYRGLKAVYFLQAPGSVIPEIFTGNLYAVGRKA